mmetsp:Transcript_8817/g.11641  ORF Transcript_8817/g.11641 Transcript_8817/m.11641 type:complete len:270 (-) Transcript_8817:73-882(-)|eukprot:CAMPEP_0117734988 /NCGR_PEP_ID=MMETSP0947-20121206/1013_1 /TAXON_ID=44440 /ORGANISM="Chattonella subsalsa, Strain CCMP2191" /LENGTH=269 /DNA_ID=CAMNT_0005549895 /DNA_START=2214 /DNA_END=3023 /DNA_ORIENTATION=-
MNDKIEFGEIEQLEGSYNINGSEEKMNLRTGDPNRIVMISDTHGKHAGIPRIPDGDILIHAGDFTMTGGKSEVMDFSEFLASLPHRLKIVIAGNHDVTFDEDYYESKGRNRFHRWRDHMNPAQVRSILIDAPGVIYLEDSGYFDEQSGLSFWGSPWSPEFCDWAFNVKCGEDCAAKWAMIPEWTDVLITHGPPYGFLDQVNPNQKNVGCRELAQEVQGRIKPRVHIFGHVHESYGCITDSNITYVNASTCDFFYKPNQPPIVVDLPRTI